MGWGEFAENYLPWWPFMYLFLNIDKPIAACLSEL